MPGLVLEVHDRENTYSFTAVSIKEANYNIISSFEDLNKAKLLNKIEYFKILDNILYDTHTLTKFSSVFEKFPPEKIQQYRKSLDTKRKKRNNFPIDKDIY